MPLKQTAAIGVLVDRWPEFEAQREHAEMLDRHYTNNLDEAELPRMPKRVDEMADHLEMRKRSTTPLLGLVVTTTSQALHVDGYVPAEGGANADIWNLGWQANGMDARQIPVHRGALAHGTAYVRVLKGKQRLTGVDVPVIRGFSAKQMIGFYDADDDEYAVDALFAERVQDGANVIWTVELYDEEAVYYFSGDGSQDGWTFIEYRLHGMGVCPVVRFQNMPDLEGSSTGEVEPFIPIVSRFAQSVFDRLAVQRDGSWRVRYATGIKRPQTNDQARSASAQMRADDMLVAEDPQARFGTLEPTSVEGYIKAADTDLRTLGATSQTPPHYLLGSMINLSAEALAAAENALMRKVTERKMIFGESWERVMRLAAWAIGDIAGAGDFSSQVQWRDTEARSMSQAADALGKMAQQLGIPVQMLWKRIPGWTQQDTKDALEMLEDDQAQELAALIQGLQGQTEETQTEGEPGGNPV